MPNIRIIYYSVQFICIFFPVVLFAQFKNVKIDAARGTIGPCEPSIAINPLNPKEIVVGAVLEKVYYSSDGGEEWAEQNLTSEYGIWGDPCIVADHQGNFYYFHLSNPDENGWFSENLLDRIVCQKSVDGGKTWNNGSFTGMAHPKDQDKEWATANHLNNELYVTWTQFDAYNSFESGDSTNILFSKSDDFGETWSEPLRINQMAGNCLDDDFAVEGAVPAVGVDGEIYVSWSRGNEIYLDYSTDGGETWQANDKVIAKQKAGWNFDIPGIGRANGMPVIHCDITEKSEFYGRVYVNYADQNTDGSDTDIWLIYSDDKGESWSDPIRVNNDNTNQHQFFQWMDVDPVTGYVYVVFYDRRNYTDNQTDVYLAYSKDGGAHFENIKISDSPFNPQTDIFFGDYNNICVYNGIVRPVWTRLEDRVLSIWTALIDFSE
ncbi:sialidase family protein [Chondrinema litorale]|uniref:sialidase family protein n=1 Tax=Chondrinema litorale TaxID=2994555 RepID=UPI002542B2D5|nr:sialidase family protein [Chondrinema litorale]UZR93643.1 sialidase family protein [Chondrinema litorale]